MLQSQIDQNLNAVQIAELHNVSRKTVDSWIEAYGLEIKNFRKRYMRPTKDQLIESLEQLLDLRSLSQKYNVPETIAEKWIKSYNLGPVSKPKASQPSREELEADVFEKLSLSKMASKYGANITTIARWMRHYDIKTLRKVGRNPGDKISPEALATKPRLFGEKNPFFGKTHTAETRKKMSENHADFAGDKNPFKKSLTTTEKRQEHSERCKQIWAKRDREWREKFAEKLSARPLNSEQKQGRNHKSGYYYSAKIDGGKFWYRSSWEKLLAEKLDSDNRVISYTFEQVRIRYNTDNNQKRWTYCDFCVTTTTGSKVMIEVKPTPIALLKQAQLEMQVKWCVDNAHQYAIVDNDIITNSYDLLIQAICQGECNAGKYVRRGPIEPTRCAEIIRNGQQDG